MTATEDLRHAVGALLVMSDLHDVRGRLRDTCLVLADALEEAGDAPGVEFWRLVADRKLWPKTPWEAARRFEWWCWTEELERFFTSVVSHRPTPPVERYRPHGVPPAVFHLLPGKNPVNLSVLEIRYYRSLHRAIFCLEKAWRRR